MAEEIETPRENEEDDVHIDTGRKLIDPETDIKYYKS
jgi:hypothetical protein